MLVIKRFRERKKVFRERNLSEKFVKRGVFLCWEWSSIYRKENPTVTAGSPGVDCMMVVKEIEDGLLEEMEKFGWWFEQDISGESEDDREK
ncbi:hypothetical protein Tco_1034287 [Tanacetum coccineum]